MTLDSSGDQLKVRESISDAVLDEQSWVFAAGTADRASARVGQVQAAAQSLAERRRARPSSPSAIGSRLLATRPSTRDGNRVGTVVVGLSLQPYEHTENISRIGTVILDLFVLLAGALTVRWSVGRALRPVEDMTSRAADWSEHDLHRRFEMGEPYDEITGLAATLDSLLARIDAAMRREQRLDRRDRARTAHAAERSPRRGRARAARRRRREPQVLRQIIAGTDRMNSAIETLLAAHVGDGGKNRWCDPRRDRRPGGRDRARRRGEQAGVEIEVTASPDSGRVETDQQVLAQTLAPMSKTRSAMPRTRPCCRSPAKAAKS